MLRRYGCFAKTNLIVKRCQTFLISATTTTSNYYGAVWAVVEKLDYLYSNCCNICTVCIESSYNKKC